MVLEVLEPGLLSTIQDGGRDAAHLGVPGGGMCDRTVREIVAWLLDTDDPVAVEMTLLGATFAVRETCVVCVTGADLGGEVVEEGRPVPPGTTALLHAGTTLRFGAARDGARAYVSLAGGIDVPEVLGSRSTCLAGGFGGSYGRPLRAGDILRPATAQRLDLAGRKWPGLASGGLPEPGVTPIRVALGPHVSDVGADALDGLLGTDWTVDPRSDRMGLRLDGPPMPGGARRELLSLPMVAGAVQLPPGGAPIVLLADHQTVGGYPVPLVVSSVDIPRLAQLRPGDRLRFDGVTIDEAFRLGMAELWASKDVEDLFERSLAKGTA
ncbi:MAG: biotin-dependent carboxyltransferase family protein [Candidatus Limnocylindrales bacterium]